MASARWCISCAVVGLLAVAGCESGGTSSVRSTPAAPAPYVAPAPVVTPRPEPAPRPPQPASLAVKNADDVFLVGKTAEALELYRSRLMVNGADLDAHDGFIRCSMKLGKLKDAVAWYEQRLNTHGAATPAWAYGASRAMLLTGDLEQSSELAYAAIRRDRALGRAYYLLGLKYRTQAAPEYKTAANAFEKAIRLDRIYGASYYQLAYLKA
ncbi:MAG TPA: hypothetical protein VMY39_02960, partial [Planctomycetota bacterium]|nr:hypothetical protein [Planctomycetota bacterium]